MSEESTNQLQGHVQSEIQVQELNPSIQNTNLVTEEAAIISKDNSIMKSEISEEDTILQACNSAQKISEISEKLASYSKKFQAQSTKSTTTYDAPKVLIRNLYNMLVYGKLPATDESINLSEVTIKIFSSTDLQIHEETDKEIEDFVAVFEVLCEGIESSDCDKITDGGNQRNISKNHTNIDELTKKIQQQIRKLKIDKSVLCLNIKEKKLEKIGEKYEKLKCDEILMKILFHKCWQQNKNNGNCDNYSDVELGKNESFSALKNFQSENGKLILLDICENYENFVVPNIQKSLSAAENLPWNNLNEDVKSTILKSYVDFQGFYIPLKELAGNNPEFLHQLNLQQISEILQNGFVKVSKIQPLSVPFYLKRTFIEEPMDAYAEESLDSCKCCYSPERLQKEITIQENTKNFSDLQKELQKFKILILTDDSGSGKTTTLKYFARKLKEENKRSWISYIDAKLSSNIFEKIKDIQDWNIDGLGDVLVEILGLNGIEIPIFKKYFKDNKVILIWDHFDEKFQSIFINFVWNINQMTENQQMLATRFRYSGKFIKKFHRTAYKFIPFTTDQIVKFKRRIIDFMNLDVKYWHFFNFCESVGLGGGLYEFNSEFFINNNILMFKLLLLSVADLKIDLEYAFDSYFLFEMIFEKQLSKIYEKLEYDDKMVLIEILQVHALKSTFDDEITKSFKIVKKYKNLIPEIPSIRGICTTNFDDKTVEFQHKSIADYFIVRFITENIFMTNLQDIKEVEAQKFVIMLAKIYSEPHKYVAVSKFLRDFQYYGFRRFWIPNEFNENLYKIIKIAKYWTKVTKHQHKKINRYHYANNFWEDLKNEIENDKKKAEEKEKIKNGSAKSECKEVPKTEKKSKKRGKVIVQKFSQNLEISNQCRDFLDDYDDYESDDYDYEGLEKV